MTPARVLQVGPLQVWEPLFVVAWPSHTFLCPSAACLDLHHSQAVKEMICALKDVLLRDEDDHALIQGSLVGPNHQACVILSRVQSDLVISEPGISGCKMSLLGSDLSERTAEELKDPACKMELSSRFWLWPNSTIFGG